MERLQELLDELHESKFYKHVNVYFGSKTKEKVNFTE